VKKYIFMNMINSFYLVNLIFEPITFNNIEYLINI